MIPCENCIVRPICMNNEKVRCSSLFYILEDEYLSNNYELMDDRSWNTKRKIKEFLPNTIYICADDGANSKLGMGSFDLLQRQGGDSDE